MTASTGALSATALDWTVPASRSPASTVTTDRKEHKDSGEHDALEAKRSEPTSASATTPMSLDDEIRSLNVLARTNKHPGWIQSGWARATAGTATTRHFFHKYSPSATVSLRELIAFGKFINAFIAKHPSLRSCILLEAPDDRTLLCCYEGFRSTETPVKIPNKGQRDRLFKLDKWVDSIADELNRAAQTGKYPGYEKAQWVCYDPGMGSAKMDLYYCPNGRSDDEIRNFLTFVTSMASKAANLAEVPMQVCIENADQESLQRYNRQSETVTKAIEARKGRVWFTRVNETSDAPEGKESHQRDMPKGEVASSILSSNPPAYASRPWHQKP